MEDKDNSLAEDFICIGCHLCGSPLVSENGYGKLNCHIAIISCMES